MLRAVLLPFSNYTYTARFTQLPGPVFHCSSVLCITLTMYDNHVSGTVFNDDDYDDDFEELLSFLNFTFPSPSALENTTPLPRLCTLLADAPLIGKNIPHHSTNVNKNSLRALYRFL